VPKSKKQKDPNTTPRLKFGSIRKEVSKEEFDNAAQEVMKAWRNDQTSARDFGWKLLKLRKYMHHSQFTKWLRSHSIDQNRASYCMRVAQGLVKAAAARRNDPLQVNVKQQLSQMYKLAKQKMLTPEAMRVHAMEVVHSICARAGKMQGWAVHDPKEKEVAPFLNALRQSLDNYLDALFVFGQRGDNNKAKASAVGRS